MKKAIFAGIVVTFLVAGAFSASAYYARWTTEPGSENYELTGMAESVGGGGSTRWH